MRWPKNAASTSARVTRPGWRAWTSAAPARADRAAPRYLFDCGAFDDAGLAGIVVQPEEIAEHRFADLATALTMLRKPIRRRVRAATRRHPLCYLEDGRPVQGVGTSGG